MQHFTEAGWPTANGVERLSCTCLLTFPQGNGRRYSNTYFIICFSGNQLVWEMDRHLPEVDQSVLDHVHAPFVGGRSVHARAGHQRPAETPGDPLAQDTPQTADTAALQRRTGRAQDVQELWAVQRSQSSAVQSIHRLAINIFLLNCHQSLIMIYQLSRTTVASGSDIVRERACSSWEQDCREAEGTAQKYECKHSPVSARVQEISGRYYLQPVCPFLLHDIVA